MKRLSILILVCGLAFFSCRKRELPQDDFREPVFYAQCEIDGKAWNVEAGSNDYSMDATYFMDSNGVYVYRADLKKNDCSGYCGYALSVLINDNSLTNGARNADSALKPGNYEFSDHHIPTALSRSVFVPETPQQPGSTYNWTVRDGIGPDKLYNGYMLNTKLEAGKAYSVTLSYNNGSGCGTSHRNIYGAGKMLQTNISAIRDNTVSTITYDYSSINTGEAPYRYSWEFNDGSADDRSSAPTVKHTYLPKLSGNYTTKLTLVDNNNDTCVSYYQVPGSLTGGCEANFRSTLLEPEVPLPFSKITVLVTYGGKVYSSRDLNQEPGSKFEIVSAENYMPNSKGDPTTKLKVRFTCKVQNGSSLLNITNGVAIIAVAHK